MIYDIQLYEAIYIHQRDGYETKMQQLAAELAAMQSMRRNCN